MKTMIIPDLYRDINSTDQFTDAENNMDKISSSLPDNMDISPSMVLSPSPAKTDWLTQFACGNKHIFY